MGEVVSLAISRRASPTVRRLWQAGACLRSQQVPRRSSAEDRGGLGFYLISWSGHCMVIHVRGRGRVQVVSPLLLSRRVGFKRVVCL
jgi:hypothetical protein